MKMKLPREQADFGFSVAFLAVHVYQFWARKGQGGSVLFVVHAHGISIRSTRVVDPVPKKWLGTWYRRPH